jgi:uncharacterized membrane protein
VQGSTDSAERGDFARVVAFSDGVFAIAITLLVLSLSVPDDLPADEIDNYLFEHWGQVFAYFLSFAVIGRFWLSHHRHFDLLDRSDDRLMTINLVYLAFVCLIPFPTAVLGDFDLTSTSVALYAGVMGAASAVHYVMTRYTLRELVRPSRRAELADLANQLWPVPVVFFASIPVGFISPEAGALSWLLLSADGLRQRLTRRPLAQGD